MKRTLTSLAAMAASGAASAQSPVALFGAPELPAVELRPVERIGPLLNDPEEAAMREMREAMAREIHRVMSVPASRIGKTAAMSLEEHDEKMLRAGWRFVPSEPVDPTATLGTPGLKLHPHQEDALQEARRRWGKVPLEPVA